MAAGTRLPRIAVVGRPNVGKSTLTNRLCGSRVSIVEPTEGVTRDRVAVPATLRGEWGERRVEVIDTGGIGVVDRDDLGPHVEEQVKAAMHAADVVVFMVDVRMGITPLDREVAQRLRSVEQEVILVCNKVEGDTNQWGIDEFRQLGIGGEPSSISAQNGNGMSDFVDRLMLALPPDEGGEVDERPNALKIALVGRRNVGKSTLINRLAREERVIVSEIPGTTRDAVDVLIERDGQTFVLIDTAGVRKKRSFQSAVEFYSDARSHKAVRRADVVLLMYDATERLSALEKRLARYATDHHKPVVLAANKWDLAEDTVKPADFNEYLDQELPGLSYAPRTFMSAATGRGVRRTMEAVLELQAQAQSRVGTGELNRILEHALEARSPSSSGHRVRIMYATQADRTPPTFVLFVNDKRLIGKNYLRYLENRLRAELPIANVPIHLILRDRSAAPSEEW